MRERGLEAMIVVGPAQHNPPMVYMTGGAHLTSAFLVKPAGHEATLYHHAMEREEAAGTGVKTVDLGNNPVRRLQDLHGLDELRAQAQLFADMLAQTHVRAGRVAVYGQQDSGRALAIFGALRELRPELELVGELEADSMLLQARATKDPGELERIRKMGEITTSVVGYVADFLSSQRASGGVLIDREGQPVRVGAVKRLINLKLAEHGVENPHGVIFAQGRSAGIPHSSGNADDELRLGETIVFDIYPREPGGGYYYDFTRTWCLGHAPDPVLELFEDVRAVYEQMMTELALETNGRVYQRRACELFEARGHPTIGSQPETLDGYVHGLGHGLGLQIHERPSLSVRAAERDVLLPGVVVTIEPGLYYPDRGMGVRLEDTVAAHADGTFEVLAPYPLDLVLPVKNAQ